MGRSEEMKIGLSTRKAVIAFVAVVLTLCGAVAYAGGSVSGALLLWFLVVLSLSAHILLTPVNTEGSEADSTPAANPSQESSDGEGRSQSTDSTGDATSQVTDKIDNETDHTTDDALAELRQRYARGEVSEEQFEHRLEVLLASDDGGDAAVAALRYRYAMCELTDEQFERKYDQLRATNTVENAEDSVNERKTISEGE